MIKETKPLSISEALEMFEDSEDEKKKEVAGFFKNFVSIKPEEAKKLRSELEEAGILKLKQESIAKIIDLLPETELELNKILVNESLDENETNKILEIAKKYR